MYHCRYKSLGEVCEFKKSTSSTLSMVMSHKAVCDDKNRIPWFCIYADYHEQEA